MRNLVDSVCMGKGIIRNIQDFVQSLSCHVLLWLIVWINIVVPLTLEGQTWTNNGPFGGFITALAINPVDTNVVYAGTYGAGMFRSNNGGMNWDKINNGFPMRSNSTIGSPTEPSWRFGDYYPVTLVRVDPSNPSHIFVGTMGGGLTTSANMGESWNTINEGLPEEAVISDLWIHPEDPLICFCGTDYPSGGLYSTLNGGQYWALVDSVPSGATYRITSISHEPGNPDILYIGLDSAGEPGLSWGLLKSNDGGDNWEVVFDGFSICDLQIDPDNPQELWGVGYTGWGDFLLFFSSDQGSTWNAYPDEMDPWSWIIGLYADSDWYLYALYAPTDGSEIKLLKSTDHGETWNELSIVLPSLPGGIRVGCGPNVAANSIEPETIYFGTYVGVYKSNDGGESGGEQVNGMVNTYIYDVEVDSKDPTSLYAGGTQGLWKSIDEGDNWFRLNTALVNTIAIDPEHTDTVYWGGSELMRSYDGGQNWEGIADDILSGTGDVTAMEIHPDSSNTLFVSVYPSTVYKTNNWGDDWILSYSPGVGSFKISDIAIDRNDPNIIYFGASDNLTNHGFYRSTDGGLLWSKISDPGQVHSIALHPVSSEVIYITADGNLKISYNGGESFHLLAEDVQGHHIKKVFIDPLTPKHLLITTSSGVFFSTNDGETWISLVGPYDQRVNDVNYFSLINRIYIATNGGGVWRGDDVSLSTRESFQNSQVPEIVRLFPAYPNPFNSETVISFSLLHYKEVNIDIYNLSGQIIKNISHEIYPAGYYKVTWDGTNQKGMVMASGIYLVLLQSDSFLQIEKLSLIK